MFVVKGLDKFDYLKAYQANRGNAELFIAFSLHEFLQIVAEFF